MALSSPVIDHIQYQLRTSASGDVTSLSRRLRRVRSSSCAPLRAMQNNAQAQVRIPDPSSQCRLIGGHSQSHPKELWVSEARAFSRINSSYRFSEFWREP